MSRISPWLLGVLFLGLAVGAIVMPLSSDVVPYAFLFDRTEDWDNSGCGEPGLRATVVI